MALASALAACLLAASAAADTTKQWQVAVPTKGTLPQPSQVVAMLPDGGFLLRQQHDSYRYTELTWMSEFDADGTLRHAPRLLPSLRSPEIRLRADGSLLDQPEHPTLGAQLGCELVGQLFGRTVTRHYSWDRFYVLPSDRRPLPALDVASVIDTQRGNTKHLALLDAFCDSRVLGPIRVLGATPASDGRSVIGIQQAGETTWLRRIGPDGEMWSRELPSGWATIAEVAANGDALVLYDGVVARIGEDGALRWQLPETSDGTYVADIAAHGSHTYVVERKISEGSRIDYRAWINVIDARGTQVARHALNGRIRRLPSIANPATWQVEPPDVSSSDPVKVVTLTPEGDLQTLGEFDSDLQPTMQLASGRIVTYDQERESEFLFDPSNGERLPLSAPELPLRQQLVSMQNLGGDALLVVRNHDETLRLIRVDADGTQRWQRRLAVVNGDPFFDTNTLGTNSRRACFVDQRQSETRLHCVDAATGNDILADLRSPVRFAGTPSLRLAADSSLQLVGNDCVPFPDITSEGCQSVRFVRVTLAPNGSLVQHEVLSPQRADEWHWSASAALVSTTRRSASGSNSNSTQFTVYDERGGEPHRFEVQGDEWLRGIRSDGTLLSEAAANGSDERFLRLRSPIGTLLWEIPTGTERVTNWATPLPGGDWLLAAILPRQSNQRLTVIERRDGSDGALRWQRRIASAPLRADYPFAAQLTLDDTARWLWVTGAGREHARMIALDVTDGTLADAQLLEVPTGDDARYLSFATAVASDDGVIAGWVRDADQSLQVAKLVPTPTLAAGTPAAGGIWHAADTEGQGLLLERFDGDTLGGAWFTFSRTGGSAISEKRWYTLLGTPDDEGSYALTIYTARGGAFAAPPSVNAEPVGSARLRMTGCNSALLTYHFSEGELADLSSIVPLQRTAGAAQGCPSSARTKAANGAAGALSGSFFDPEASGQGLLLQAVGDGTMLAGAWFTFDPAGKANDPGAQHWFSAAGPLAAGGSGTLTLYRTFGAAFDVGRTINTVAVGTLQVSPEGCGITIAWSFDDSLAAGDFAGGEGSRRLQRLGACPQ